MREVHEAWIDDIPLCVTDGASPAMISLQHTFAAQNFTQYIKTRLKKTAYGTFYRDASYSFAAQVFEMDTADLPKRASAQRLMFDKVWQPWNTSRYKGEPPAVCACCGAIDSLDHLLSECPDAFTTKLRKETIEAAREVVSHEDDLFHAVFDAVLEILAQPHGANLYRGLWQPAQIETLRQLLHDSLNISLEPCALQNTSPAKIRIHTALVRVSSILAQGALNIMRHRNAQTQDAIHPTRKQQAGRHIPSPLDLYNSHKATGTKKHKRPRPPAALTTRVTIAHPPPQLRKATPRERARTYNAAVMAAILNERAKRAITNAEMHAATYAAPFPHSVEPSPLAWDLIRIPYHAPNGPLQDVALLLERDA